MPGLLLVLLLLATALLGRVIDLILTRHVTTKGGPR